LEINPQWIILSQPNLFTTHDTSMLTLIRKYQPQPILGHLVGFLSPTLKKFTLSRLNLLPYLRIHTPPRLQWRLNTETQNGHEVKLILVTS
jgi:hypothetical protein